MKKHTILWADDDTDDLMLMREILSGSSENFEIIEVHNGRKALDYLHSVRMQKEYPCLIVLDMNMPILSGRETLAIIKSELEFSNIPVVVFTTSSSSLDKMFCDRFGVEMITKPPSYASLKEVVEKLLTFCAFQKNKTIAA